MNEIQRFQLKEKVRMSFYRHRGLVSGVIEDLKEQGIDVKDKFVKSAIEDLKKHMDSTIKNDLSYLIMHELWSGHKEQDIKLSEGDNALSKYMTFEASVCCNAPVVRKMEGGEERLYCGRCKKMTPGTWERPDLAIYGMRLKIDEQKRKHSEKLVEFAKAMGFTNSEQATIIKQNNLIIQQEAESNRRHVDSAMLDPEVVKRVEELPPQDKDYFARELEKHIVDDDNKPE